MNDLTPEQQEAVERAYSEAFQRWLEEAKPDGNMSRYFFYAGAQLGLELAQSIYSDTIGAK